MKETFGPQLLRWYARNKRTLPWRDTDDPYKIWLSEIILQQTRVNQGLAYYEKFIASFPDVYSLAQAPAKEIFKLWQGLGYYNRAENLMKAAKRIVTDFQGRFPQDLKTLKNLPGIGDYTAAAIASLAFHQPHAVVDGNVYRVLSRIFGIETPINTARGKKEFTALALELLAGNPPAAFNQALMEFGALFCVPKNPACDTCPFRQQCFARMAGRVSDFPVKAKKAAPGHRYYYYFVLQLHQNGNSFYYLKKRTGRDIWRNLYDFPALETSRPLSDPLDSLSHLKNTLPEGFPPFSAGSPSGPYTQQLTHLKVSAYFIPVFLTETLTNGQKKSLFLVQQKQLTNFPVPRLIARYLQDNKLIKD